MIFNIEDRDFDNPAYIKVIDSIAGAGKSSLVDAYMSAHGIPYLRLTSTHTLRKDAEARFGGTVKTICAGLFDNSAGFRNIERDDLPYKTVVIDEILQDGAEAIHWAMHHVGKYNIIITTDSHQMIAPETETATMEAFSELCGLPYTIVAHVDKTLRAANEQTAAMFDMLYAMEDCRMDVGTLAKWFPVIDFDKSILTPDNVFITHTNEIENYIYKLADIRRFPLIGKGRLASKDADSTRYAVVPELIAKKKKLNAYFQASNIATPTRYQGQEVEPGQTLYYLVEAFSSITSRELYTVVTRCKDVRSLIVVVVSFMHAEHVPSFGNRAVKPAKVPVFEASNEPASFSTKASERLLALSEANPDEVYAAGLELERIGKDMRLYATASEAVPPGFKAETIDGQKSYIRQRGGHTRSKIAELLKKDETCQLDYMSRVYEIIYKRTGEFRFIQPRFTEGGAGAIYVEPFYDGSPLRLMDVFSAYGTVGRHSLMPRAGQFYTEPAPERLNFYIYTGERQVGGFAPGCIMTERLADYVKATDPTLVDYVFSTDCQVSNKLFDYAYETARKGTKGKARVSALHWGYMERPYIALKPAVVAGEYHEFYPVLNESSTYQLIFCALCSELTLIMLKARDSVGGGRILVDGLYYRGDTVPTVPEWLEYRVCDMTKPKEPGKKYDNVMFYNYDTPASKDTARRKARKAAAAALKAQKAAALAEKKRAERAAKAAKAPVKLERDRILAAINY